jgi:hypothetical protein
LLRQGGKPVACYHCHVTRMSRLVAVCAFAAGVAVVALVLSRSGSLDRPPQRVAGLPVGGVAPPFTLHGMRADVRSRDYRGRSIVLAFLSPECRPCGADVRRLGAIAPKLIGPAGADTLYVVADVQGRAGASAMEQFVQANGARIGLLVGSDSTGGAWRRYRVEAPGTVFVIGADGRVAWRAKDPTAASVRAALSKL